MKLDATAVAALVVPLVLLGFLAGAVRAASHRAAAPRTRSILTFAWLSLLLLGAPLWLFLAATLRLL